MSGKAASSPPPGRPAARMGRRQRQKLENPERAHAMHAARLAYQAKKAEHTCAQVDVQPMPPALNIGCSGWFYRHWEGVFYPAEIPTSKWFPYYADHFSTVELNAPFYSWPLETTVKSWLRQARGHPFIYTVKVNELITHSKRFTGVKTLVRDFGHIADLLGDRMGCFLFQLPPGFDYTPGRLRTIIAALDPKRRNVVEFRDASWWNDHVYGGLREAGAIFCVSSAPKLPDDLIRTADDIYIRFHGADQWYRANYSKQALAEWAARIADSGAHRVWAYFNNDRDGYAIKNAQELKRLLARAKARRR